MRNSGSFLCQAFFCCQKKATFREAAVTLPAFDKHFKKELLL